ncbi:MAG: hypothetical protein OEV73_01790 [Desulfobulbaceae bacterium]|nr:hypothetical protein [Desulfobulbaceae bacterium]
MDEKPDQRGLGADDDGEADNEPRAFAIDFQFIPKQKFVASSHRKPKFLNKQYAL